MTFKQYVTIKNQIGSFRAKLMISNYNLQSNQTIETLIIRDAIGIRTAKDILKLQQKYLNKFYVLKGE